MKLSRIWNCVNIATTMLLLVSELSLRLKKKNEPDVRHSFRSPYVHVIVKRIRVFYSWLYTFIMC